MKRISCYFILALMIVSLLSGCNRDQKSIAQLIEEGNQLYNQGKYQEAINIYQSGLTVNSGNQQLNYNLANALYRLGKYKESLSYYNQVTKDKEVYMNIGNVYKMLGDQSKQLAEKIKNYQEALNNYKSAIKLDMNDKELKFNYEYVNKLLRELNDKQQNKQDNKKKEENKDNQEKKQDNEGKEDSQDKKQQNKENSQNQNTKQQNQSDKQKQQDNKGAEEKESKSSGDSQTKENKEDGKQEESAKESSIKEEDGKLDQKKLQEAFSILQALEKEEEDSLKNNQKIKKPGDNQGDKYDW